MIRGHTNLAPDRFFGLLKKQFRQTFVSTLDELTKVVKKSMIAGQNIPQLTKEQNSQRRYVVWLDWKSYLSMHFHTIPRITDYHHFRFDEKSPGVVFVRVLAKDEEREIRIPPDIIPFCGLLSENSPKGMDITRQWYLYNEIRLFCSSEETAKLTCPQPVDPEQSNASKGSNLTASKQKRKRACSHCHQEGHTKTKKGKITCPSLL